MSKQVYIQILDYLYEDISISWRGLTIDSEAEIQQDSWKGNIIEHFPKFFIDSNINQHAVCFRYFK